MVKGNVFEYRLNFSAHESLKETESRQTLDS